MTDEQTKLDEVKHFLLPKRFFKRLPKYLKSFKGHRCFSCSGNAAEVVPAHIRFGETAGTGNKPDDDLCLPLCRGCHELEGAGEVKFWRGLGFEIDEIKDVARARYRRWADDG